MRGSERQGGWDLEKASYIFLLFCNTRNHSCGDKCDIIVPCKTDLMETLDDSACSGSCGGNCPSEIILNLLGLTIICLFLTIFFSS
jgi:hypothetical protein